MPDLPTISVPKDIFPWPRSLAQEAQMQAQEGVPAIMTAHRAPSS